MSQKHHVTVEEVIDQDNLRCNNQSSLGGATIDLSQVNSGGTEGAEGRTQSEPWSTVDALEEQARSEKLENQSTAIQNAAATARMVKDAQQSSGY